MICPFCGREMKKGTLGGNILWYPETEKNFLEKVSNSITIRNNSIFESSMAFLCFHCHKLIMDVPERANFKFMEE